MTAKHAVKKPSLSTQVFLSLVLNDFCSMLHVVINSLSALTNSFRFFIADPITLSCCTQCKTPRSQVAGKIVSWSWLAPTTRTRPRTCTFSQSASIPPTLSKKVGIAPIPFSECDCDAQCLKNDPAGVPPMFRTSLKCVPARILNFEVIDEYSYIKGPRAALKIPGLSTSAEPAITTSTISAHGISAVAAVSASTDSANSVPATLRTLSDPIASASTYRST